MSAHHICAQSENHSSTFTAFVGSRCLGKMTLLAYKSVLVFLSSDPQRDGEFMKDLTAQAVNYIDTAQTAGMRS